MRSARIVSLILLATFLMASIQPMAEKSLSHETKNQSLGRSTGVDLSVTDISFSYASSTDQAKYQMFSSNHPIANFDRPANLYVVDSVINVPISISFTIQNLGNSNSGSFNVIISIIHNEYTDFELHNETVSVNSIGGGGSTSAQKTITPTYSGNHTLRLIPVNSIIDDNPNNDRLTKSFTVASNYFNCDDLTGWSVGNQWNSNADTALSQGYGCHIGNGQFSTYSNNLNTALITPYMDMSDAVNNPSRTNGISFYYTGSILAGDILKIYVNDNNGNWNEIASISGTIDQNFGDGANWQTWSVNHAGAYSPLVPVQQQYFNSQTQFKFEFTSDAINNDIGLWIDDIVIVYDQKVKEYEYGLTITGISTNGAVPGSWGQSTVEITNIGNITETFIPSLSGLPMNWDMYFSTSAGVSINPTYGITLQPDETRQFVVNFKPDSLASQGFHQVVLTGHSNQYNSIQSQLNMQFQVIPDRIPEISLPSSQPSCKPGNTCTFEVGITNIGEATDVFDVSIEPNKLPIGWSVALAWSQPSSILSQPGVTNSILMTFTIPSDALPDSIGKFDLRVTSQNDSSRFDIREIEITASMISNAEVSMNLQSTSSEWSIKPGESRIIYYTIWNNATSQDIFTPSVTIRDVGQWIIEQPSQTSIVINPGKQSTFSITITAPEQSQVGDVCPKLTPVVTSARSGDTFNGVEFDGMEVSRRDDLSISLIDQPVVYQAGNENMILIEIENKGNGPNEANIELIGLPNDWSWNILIDGNLESNPISLSAIYDLDYIKQVQISISPNSTTFAGSSYQYNIKISPFDGTIDENMSDNEVSLEAVISTNYNIVIDTQSDQLSTGVGNYTNVEAILQNLGNIEQSNVMLRAQISMLGSNVQLNPYFTIGDNGIVFDLDTYHPINLEIGQLYELKIIFKVPENIDIDTKIVVTFDVQSTNNSGLIFQSSQTLIEIDYRRSMEVQLYSYNEGEIDESIGARAFVNLTSTSTMSEKFTLNLMMPQYWQAVCSGVIINPNGTIIEKAPGNIEEQFTSTSCEIYPLEGDDSGEVVFKVENSDGTLEWSESKTYLFKRNAEESFNFSTNMIAGSIAGLLAVAIITILVLRTRNNEYLEDEMNEEKIEESTVSGPPISGPPASVQFDSSPQPINNITSSIPGQYSPVVNTGPAIPASGLPEGWTHEQWKYYGQKYLDRLNSGGNQ